MADDRLNLTVQVNAETGQLEVIGQQFDALGQKTRGLSGEVGSLFKSFLPFATAAGVIGFFSESVKAAEDENVALGRLKFQVEALGQSWEHNRAGVTAWAQAIQESTRFSDGQAYDAVGRLMRVTGDLTQAQRASQLAMSLSVASGKDLGSTTDFVANLVNKHTRALMEGNREFGAFTGGAKDAQSMLNALSKNLGDAAFKEQGLTKETEMTKHQFEDLMKTVGQMFLPAISGLLSAFQTTLSVVQHLGTAFANFAQLAIDSLSGIGQAFKAAFKMDWDGVKQAAADTMRQIGYDMEAADQVHAQIDEKKTARALQGSNARVQVVQRETQEEERLRKEQAAKVQDFEEQINKNLAALSTQSFKRKQQEMQADIAARRLKIQREITDETQKQKLLAELDNEQLKRTDFLAKEETKIKFGQALETADLAVQTFQVLNSMGQQHTQSELNRARVLLALEKAIAIARLWSAEAGKGILGVAIASAGTALLAAQFAQQSQALGQAQSQFNQQAGNSIGNLPSIHDTGGSGSSGAGSPSFGTGGTSFGSGGGGPVYNIQIGDIILQGINDASKVPDNVVEAISLKIIERIKARGELNFTGTGS